MILSILQNKGSTKKPFSANQHAPYYWNTTHDFSQLHINFLQHDMQFSDKTEQETNNDVQVSLFRWLGMMICNFAKAQFIGKSSNVNVTYKLKKDHISKCCS